MAKAVIIDDEAPILELMSKFCRSLGHEISGCQTGAAGIAALREIRPDFVIVDLLIGDVNGLDVIRLCRTELPTAAVIMVTAHGSVETAVEAMRLGVRNFVQKPWDNAQLVTILRTEVDAGRVRRQQAAVERRELDEARRIQRKLLPSTMPALEGWEVSVSWQPAAGVGGDCFDAIPFGPARLGLSIADVVGKGIPAALLMANLQAAVRAFATNTTEPAELCQQVNRILCGHIAEGRFISFFYCIVDHDESTLTFANAGHYPPILIRADGTIERLDTGGAVLGVFPERGYEQGQVSLRGGDRIILYTDGITDVCNAADEEFGEARLVDLAVANRGCSAPALQARLANAVDAFSDGRFQDDATLIVLAAEQSV